MGGDKNQLEECKEEGTDEGNEKDNALMSEKDGANSNATAI